jgi:hypothetical protein
MSYGVFSTQAWESRYVTAAWFAKDRAQSPALFLARQHSGSLRYYAGLPTTRYDLGTIPDLFSRMRKVRQTGAAIYLLADGEELARLRASERGILLVGAEEIGHVEPGRVTLLRLDPPFVDLAETPPRLPLDATFAGQIALRGYDPAQPTVRPGEPIALTLYWEALRLLDRDYLVFVHAVDEQGQIVAQSDSHPVGDRYPTSAWAPRYVVRDARTLVVPVGTRPGRLRLVAGLYQREPSARLPVVAGGGPAADEIELGTVDVP